MTQARPACEPPGALPGPGGVRFRVLSPRARLVEVVCDGIAHPMTDAPDGYFEAVLASARPGSRYGYRLDGGPLWPDPASRFQPDGVHGLSQVIDPAAYRWRDDGYLGVARPDLVLYELHVGTFTPAGSFAGVAGKLPYLRDLGVTAVELMPVADFPGQRGWGYDPAALWAPARCYGHPDDLRALVDAAHRHGLAVFLDVIYNHLGPDGAHVSSFAPMFSQRHTPWGQAMNLDGPGSAGVRAFLLDNAIYWLDEFHIDGLRLDATFALFDDSPRHFLAELAGRARSLAGPPRVLIAEDPRHCDWVVRPARDGGFGLDGVWADDFHNLVRRKVTGEDHGPLCGYPGSSAALARCVADGWYELDAAARARGQKLGHEDIDGHVPAGRRARPASDAAPARGLPHQAFVFFLENHDQVGNRPRGDRLHHSVEPALYRALSALLLLVPEIPLLFMGQEWGASTPFYYFTDHHEELGKHVRDGRERELARGPDAGYPVPDPQALATFQQSALDWAERDRGRHAAILALHRDVLVWRRQLTGDVTVTSPCPGSLVLGRGEPGARTVLAVALEPFVAIDLGLPARPPGPAAPRIVWHSESAVYAAAPCPPRLHTGRGTLVLDCERPLAALVR